VSLWRQLARGLRALRNRPIVNAELADEVRDFYYKRVSLVASASQRAVQLGAFSSMTAVDVLTVVE
jgi:hypothetical protein